jgi:hypothetical protein
MEYQDLLEAAFWITVWLASSPLVMLCMKSATSTQEYQFPYPWLLLGASNVVTLILTKLLLLVPSAYQDSTKASSAAVATSDQDISWKHASLLGVIQGVEVGLGAMVIHLVSVSLRTEIHMMVPSFMYLGGLIFGLESCDSMLAMSIVLMTLGGVLATYGNMSLLGLEMIPVSILAGMIAVARWTLTQKCLAPPNEPRKRPSPLMLLYKMSPATSITCLLGSLIFEANAYSHLRTLPHQQIILTLTLAVGIGAVAMLVAELRAVQLTSALFLGLMTPLHNVTIIAGDVLLKGTRISIYNTFGICFCCVAACIYGEARRRATHHHVRQTEKQKFKDETGTQDSSSYSSCSAASA